jgi:hypothetical protein
LKHGFIECELTLDHALDDLQLGDVESSLNHQLEGRDVGERIEWECDGKESLKARLDVIIVISQGKVLKESCD